MEDASRLLSGAVGPPVARLERGPEDLRTSRRSVLQRWSHHDDRLGCGVALPGGLIGLMKLCHNLCGRLRPLQYTGSRCGPRGRQVVLCAEASPQRFHSSQTRLLLLLFVEKVQHFVPGVPSAVAIASQLCEVLQDLAPELPLLRRAALHATGTIEESLPTVLRQDCLEVQVPVTELSLQHLSEHSDSLGVISDGDQLQKLFEVQFAGLLIVDLVYEPGDFVLRVDNSQGDKHVLDHLTTNQTVASFEVIEVVPKLGAFLGCEVYEARSLGLLEPASLLALMEEALVFARPALPINCRGKLLHGCHRRVRG
mmetsp:Transcript_95781/g.132895  ORF Transcript_95781/g.132895 Transcript_95781/m.132895 type:complete len:311 (-) Transcript_95781:121-1053(-)